MKKTNQNNKHKNKPHTVNTFPSWRTLIADTGLVQSRKNELNFFAEIDITNSLKWIKKKRKKKEDISFTAFMVKSIATVLEEFPDPSAMLYNNKKTITFKEIDVVVPVEKEFQNQKVVATYIIRNIQDKTIRMIWNEIEQAKLKTMESEKDFNLNPENQVSLRLLKFFMVLPKFLRINLIKLVKLNPFERKKRFGTFGFSNIGNVESPPGWYNSNIMDSLGFVANAIVKKPWVVKGKIKIRDILYLSIYMDHDIIDGANGARFIEKLKNNLERI